MANSTVELKGYSSTTVGSGGFVSSTSPPSWQASSEVGDINPTYQGINDQSNSMDPTIPNERMYDFVPGQDNKIMEEKPAPPPGRRTTNNVTYEHTNPVTVQHPQAMSRNHSNGDVEAEPDFEDEGTYSCLRTCFLSIVVMISLCLAIIAVVLVLLLWFRVIDTQQECPTAATTMSNTGTTTEASTSNCDCGKLEDVQSTIDRISEEAANLTAQIEQLTAEIAAYATQNANVTVVTDSLDVAINSVNSSCVNTLSDVTEQLGSIESLNFEAQLLNVAVFNQCVYEYLDECQMPETINECQTEYFQTVVPGYSNIDLACHIGVSEPSGGITFAPITNLRFNTTTTDSSDSDEVILNSSSVRCECSVVGIVESATRNEIFHCKLYRSRCKTVETFDTTIVT